MRHLAPPTLPSQIPRFVIKAAIGSRSGSHFPPGNSVWARSGSWRSWLASYRRLNRKKAASLGVNSRQMLPSTTETDSGVTVKGAKVTRSADSLELLLPGARLPSGQRRLQNPPAKSKFLADRTNSLTGILKLEKVSDNINATHEKSTPEISITICIYNLFHFWNLPSRFIDLLSVRCRKRDCR